MTRGIKPCYGQMRKVPDRGKSKCKGSVVTAELAFFRNTRMITISKEE